MRELAREIPIRGVTQRASTRAWMIVDLPLQGGGAGNDYTNKEGERKMDIFWLRIGFDDARGEERTRENIAQIDFAEFIRCVNWRVSLRKMEPNTLRLPTSLTKSTGRRKKWNGDYLFISLNQPSAFVKCKTKNQSKGDYYYMMDIVLWIVLDAIHFDIVKINTQKLVYILSTRSI